MAFKNRNMEIRDKLNQGWSDIDIKQFFKITTKQLEMIKNDKTNNRKSNDSWFNS